MHASLVLVMHVRMAPASRMYLTTLASSADRRCLRAMTPAELGMPLAWKLSLHEKGTPSRGFLWAEYSAGSTRFDRILSTCLASASASSKQVLTTQLINGFTSLIRSMYTWTSSWLVIWYSKKSLIFNLYPLKPKKCWMKIDLIDSLNGTSYSERDQILPVYVQKRMVW